MILYALLTLLSDVWGCLEGDSKYCKLKERGRVSGAKFLILSTANEVATANKRTSNINS